MNNQIIPIPPHTTPTPTSPSGMYAVLANKLNDTTWECGILGSHKYEPLTWPDGSLWRIAITEDEADTYTQGFRDGKELHYNTETKQLSLVDKVTE